MQSVAFTYSEPTIFNEYVTDAAEAARAAGLKSVVVTNGFIQQAPLKRICQRVDAIKIDLKAFSADYYRNVVNGQLQPILDNAGHHSQAGTVAGDRVSDGADSQRPRRGDPRHVALDQDGARPRRPDPFHALHAALPAEEPAADSGADAGARQGSGRCGRAALRVHRQCAGTSGGEHVLSQVPHTLSSNARASPSVR